VAERRVAVELVDIEAFVGLFSQWTPEQVAMRFTPAEVDWCEGKHPRHYAVRWAAKRAFLKAAAASSLDVGRLQDIEVWRGADGRPVLRLHGAARRWARAAGVLRINVSLSHSGQSALAVVVIEFDEEEVSIP